MIWTHIFWDLSKKSSNSITKAIKTPESPLHTKRKMNDMPQMPETTGFAALYAETNDLGHQDLAEWYDNWMAVAAVGLACLAAVGAAGYAAYKWCKDVKQE